MSELKRCYTLYCYNDTKNKYCAKCATRRWREANPIKAAYNNLRSHAKERGIMFSLSLVHFAEFCTTTNYLQLRGIGKNDMTIDRIRPELGYSDGNLQMLTNAENKKKDYRDRAADNHYYATKSYRRAA